MKQFTVYQSESKSNMGAKKEVGKINLFPESKTELTELVNKLDDEQVRTLLNLLEVQVKVFTRSRLGGNEISFADCLKLQRKTNYGNAIAQVEKQIEQLIVEMAEHPEQANDLIQQQLELLKKKQTLERKRDEAKAKRKAKK